MHFWAAGGLGAVGSGPGGNVPVPGGGEVVSAAGKKKIEIGEKDLADLSATALFAGLPIAALVVGADGEIRAANPAARELLRQGSEELVGRDLASLSGPGASWSGSGAQVVALATADGVVEVEVSDGPEFTGSAGGVARLVFLSDRTSETVLSRRLEAGRARFRQTVENAGDGFLVFSADLGELHDVSEGGLRLWFGEGEAPTPDPLSVVHPEDRGAFEREKERMVHRRRDLQVRLVDATGTTRHWIHLRTYPMPGVEGGPTEIGVVIEDVTGRKRVGEMLAQARQHAARLVQAVQDPQGIMGAGGALGRVVAGMGHEDTNEERRIFAARAAGLTPREREVMELLVAGGTTRAMAAELALSPKTVEVYRARVMKKMEAPSLAALVRLVVLGRPTGGDVTGASPAEIDPPT